MMHFPSVEAEDVPEIFFRSVTLLKGMGTNGRYGQRFIRNLVHFPSEYVQEIFFRSVTLLRGMSSSGRYGWVKESGQGGDPQGIAASWCDWVRSYK